MDSSIQIEERAATWLARRGSGAWSESEESAFQAWLEESTLHVVAFVRLEAAWDQAKRLGALRGGAKPGEIPALQDWQLTPFFEKAESPDPVVPVSARERGSSRGRNRLWGLAATVLLAIGTVASISVTHFGTTYRTPVGGTASVPVSDGSNVILNTDSRIRLDISDTERRIELQKGEAFFEVAKDARRPFIVEAGEKRVVAVGTRFSVRRDGNDVRVLVEEGRVRVEDLGRERTLTAGTVAQAGARGLLVEEKTLPEVEENLSWRTGHLMFRSTPLGDAVAEFNRYNTRQIVIRDPAVAAIRVSGKFRATQFEAFVRLLEDGFPIEARRLDDRIELTDARHSKEERTANE